MANVFLSYSRDDVAKARAVALVLEKAGHKVWWDHHIKGGAQYSKEIETALMAAEAVIVLWSEQSVDSAWVRDEAAAGRDTGRLVPVLIGKTEPPLGFRQYQNIDLLGWNGRGKTAGLKSLVEAVSALSTEPVEASPPKPARWPVRLLESRRARLLWGAGLLVALMLAALVAWQPWNIRSSAPIVAITAASQTIQVRVLARDLLSKLGNLHVTQTDELKLIQGDDAGTDADLIMEVDGTIKGQSATANLILLSGKNRALLWSKDFEQPLMKQGDLSQQLAHTAAKVIECAVEALTSEGARMRQETLKRYLNGCSAYAEVATYDPRPLVPVFRAVVEQAPRFEAAWGSLIHAETEVATSNDWLLDAGRIKPHLLRHLAEARKLNPDMAEVLIAESELVPTGAFARRMQLLERAVERNPESSKAVAAYSSSLMKVGRSYEAVERAERAVQLDPLSPSTRDNLITVLAYAGDIDAANEELRKAEQLWPGASNLLGARYRIHLRYGDPQEAIRIQRLGEYGGPHRDAFLAARIDPTPAKIEQAISRPREWIKHSPQAVGELAQVLGQFGKEDELFAILLNWQHPNHVDSITEILFRPALRKFRRDPRMMAVAKRIGLLEYWRQSGKWPDFCREPDLPYNCKAEAAKLD